MKHTPRIGITVAVIVLGYAAMVAAQSVSAPSPRVCAPPPDHDAATATLFDGKNFDNWHQRDNAPSRWKLQSDGSVLVHGGDAMTLRQFGDHQLHLEFLLSDMPDKSGQARSNSGVYIHGRYEVQVLDSHGEEPAINGCGALYSIAKPLTNASKPTGQWQCYDIAFRAPRFDEAGTVVELPRITVLHNGVVIHNNLELPHTTPGGLDDKIVRIGPLLLQDHGDPVRFRNIWVRPLE